MANSIKYNTVPESNALNKGNWWIGTGDIGKGPTSTTGYWNGYDIPVGGYVVYLNKATGGPSVYALNSDAELISLTNQIASASYTTVNQCFNYYNGQSDKMILDRDYEEIVTDGLIMNLDAGFIPSYPRNGNTWYDLSGNGNNASRSKGSWNSSGYWDSEFDANYYGGRDRLRFEISNSTSLYNAFSTTTGAWSIEEIIKIDDNTYPEAAAGSVASNSAYSSGQIGFDWNHGTYNTQIQMGIGNNVGQPSGYDVRQSWTLPTQFQTLSTWYHRSFYWDRANNEMGVYYNGQFIGSIDISAVSGLTLYDGGGMTLGELYGWCHDGSRAIVRAYNRRLTQAEVLQNFNAQKSRFGL